MSHLDQPTGTTSFTPESEIPLQAQPRDSQNDWHPADVLVALLILILISLIGWG
jgi:hypothetical protein